jgi:sulfofructosephosphate aldolase
VAASTLDPAITVDVVQALGAAALKLLVIWCGSDQPDRRGDLVDRFLRLCDRAGVPGIVEGVVRPTSEAGWSTEDERDDAIVAAAAEFGGHRPGLYKAEVPSFGRDPVVVERRCAQVSAVLPCPWVVLSTGVAATDFPAAVAAACRGGASGFLAGRAIWADAAAAVDPVPELRNSAVARLRRLNEVVPAR